MTGALGWWRHALVAGLAAGLLAAPALDAPPGWLPCLAAVGAGAAIVGRGLLRGGPGASARSAVAGWLACLAAVGSIAGLGAGDTRLEAIAAGAFSGPPASGATATGFVAAVPRRSFGEVRFPLDTPDGRLLVVSREPVPPLEVGSGARARGTLRRPTEPFLRDEARRTGAKLVLQADELAPNGARRSGLVGVLDSIRRRAESALDEGMGPEAAALARGFVLGEDDLIDSATRDDFQRSGLAHLLAVSGQNVMLLAILAGVVLGAFGVRLRARLLLTLALIALYVPVAGGGASIQRAGVMGAAAIVATLAGRPADRAYPPLLAAAATLLIDPRFGGDVGWQLSFAAVVGIMLWASRLREILLSALGHRLPDRLAGPLAEGLALTIAATVATAPLMAHHFERLSPASLPANALVLPAVAPVMWLGMLIGMLGQLPFVPTGPLGVVEGLLVDYVAAVARLFAVPGWASASVPLPSVAGVAAAYAAILMTAGAVLAPGARRRGLRMPRRVALAGALAVLLVLVASTASSAPDVPDQSTEALRITELDVGQGDAILLQPPRGAPVLVDGGPPGGAAVERLRELGVDRLRAVFVTHDDLDHVGGAYEVLAALSVGRLIHAAPAPDLIAAARAVGSRIVRTAQGDSFRVGRMTLDVLWPPRGVAPAEDGNLTSLVLAARFRGYNALLSGDAEVEATHLDPGPLDVLKVAHHGSEDAGLGALLDRSVPRVALIGVGADNGYGHPTEETLSALAERGVCVLRTDLDGSSTVELGPAGVSAWTEAGAPPPGCAR